MNDQNDKYINNETAINVNASTNPFCLLLIMFDERVEIHNEFVNHSGYKVSLFRPFVARRYLG